MKEIIKNNIGWVGFAIGMIMIFIGYYYNKNVPLVKIGFFLWISSIAIDMELKKPKPKVWYIYLVTIATLLGFYILVVK